MFLYIPFQNLYKPPVKYGFKYGQVTLTLPDFLADTLLMQRSHHKSVIC